MVDILGTRKGERVHAPVLRHDALCHSVEIEGRWMMRGENESYC
jgi:hypothetical protein